MHLCSAASNEHGVLKHVCESWAMEFIVKKWTLFNFFFFLLIIHNVLNITFCKLHLIHFNTSSKSKTGYRVLGHTAKCTSFSSR